MSVRLGRQVLLATGCLLLPGCTVDSRDDPAVDPAAVADTVDGVPRLTYGEGRAATLRWTFDTVAVIGGSEAGGAENHFGGVTSTGLAGAADGSLYVLDRDGVRALGFGPDGSPIGHWGRQGSGPGELGAGFGGGPRSMALEGDTLWIHDPANQRFTLFPVGGGEPTSIPLTQSVQGIGGHMAMKGEGLVAVVTALSFSAGATPRFPLVRIDRSGTPRDTLWMAPAPQRRMVQLPAGADGRTSMMMVARVFGPGFSWVQFNDGGLAIQESAAYAIQLVDATGTRHRTIRRLPEPRPTTEADRQRYLDSLLIPPSAETPFNTDEARRRRAEATTFADVIPRIVRMRRDTDDRLWVGVSEETPGSIERIDVYDRDGALLGELRDTPMPLLFFGDAAAAILDEDELGVQRIHIVRLVESDGSERAN